VSEDPRASFERAKAMARGAALPQPIVPEPPDDAEKILDYLSELNRAIEEAQDIASALPLRDKAQAMRWLARKLHLDRDMRNLTSESVIRSERRMGEILLTMDKNNGGNPNWLHDETSSPPTYEDLGIDKSAAHRCQLLARVDRLELDAFIREKLEQHHELTSASAYSFAQASLGGHGAGYMAPDATLDGDAAQVLWDLVGLFNRAGRVLVKMWWKR